MKKKKSTEVYFRYEFSNEAGNPEGGDIFKFTSMEEVQDMTKEILKVGHSDNVAVNLTIGEEKAFFGFLKKAGMNRKDVEKEMVDRELAPVTTAKKAPKKKAKAKKTKAKAKKK